MKESGRERKKYEREREREMNEKKRVWNLDW